MAERIWLSVARRMSRSMPEARRSAEIVAWSVGSLMITVSVPPGTLRGGAGVVTQVQHVQRLGQRLQIGIRDHKLDAFHLRVDHSVHGVSTTAAYADDFDFCVVARIFGELNADVFLIGHRLFSPVTNTAWVLGARSIVASKESVIKPDPYCWNRTSA